MISDFNSIEFDGNYKIYWKKVYNLNFNYGEFAIIKNKLEIK